MPVGWNYSVNCVFAPETDHSQVTIRSRGRCGVAAVKGPRQPVCKYSTNNTHSIQAAFWLHHCWKEDQLHSAARPWGLHRVCVCNNVNPQRYRPPQSDVMKSGMKLFCHSDAAWKSKDEVFTGQLQLKYRGNNFICKKTQNINCALLLFKGCK